MLKNNDGYTLIEAIVAFGLTILIVSLIPLTLKALMWSPFFGSYSRLELNIYSNQLAVDVGEAEEVLVSQNKLDVIKRDEHVTYQLTSGSIRRLVGGRGYVPMLDSVKGFSCEKDGAILTCETVMENGHVHSRSLSSMLTKIEEPL
ncbi:ComGF family competence protein [Alkalicoccobacillus porphyridii]|uniref:Prepilin-type N-terminal cleavage/methylation domain-containing protein n=1 Tax=Alkalicoccobacillus porphyridii TaxID=2597270 RepID=A0A553ZTJ2_9BACI|nr:ComGF family competence protein [Alkalicoccobacillus porphyridii]TSB44723.1 hypothetical protein FN960_20010 [Alkalicoccobacillus porphyridii]